MEKVNPNSLKVDPVIASLMPPSTEIEQKNLEESIREHGVIVPIIVTKSGLVVDGHRRLATAKALGLKEVPIDRRAEEGENWEEVVGILVNLDRRHLNEATRAALGSSLERIERAKAKERQTEGAKQGGETGGRSRPKEKPGGNRSPKAIEKARKKEENHATARVAARVGVSRKTYERVSKVNKADPKLAKDMLAGKISVAGAAKKIAVEEIKRKVEKEVKVEVPGLIRDLTSVQGKYRCLYVDPPWGYADSGSRGTAAQSYPTVEVADLCDKKKFPIESLAHKDGCHLWLWTTWPKIRDGVPHGVLETWGFRWVGEVVWHKKGGVGIGRWLRPVTEILILAVKGNMPLLDDKDLAAYLGTDRYAEKKEGDHSKKPEEFRALVERLSPGPRIELFSRKAAEGLDRWGLEA
jgi:N6-adenosine-specific RNA methylase IME4